MEMEIMATMEMVMNHMEMSKDQDQTHHTQQAEMEIMVVMMMETTEIMATMEMVMSH